MEIRTMSGPLTRGVRQDLADPGHRAVRTGRPDRRTGLQGQCLHPGNQPREAIHDQIREAAEDSHLLFQFYLRLIDERGIRTSGPVSQFLAMKKHESTKYFSLRLFVLIG